jgi:tRNA-dihydrouridine synthase
MKFSWSDLPNPFFVLAPMDDVTDTVFRQMVAGFGRPDVFFTEFINVDGLQSRGRAALAKKLASTPAEDPLVIQLWGLNPENYFKTAQEVAASGQYAAIDINMGCPAKVVVKKGCCAGLIKTPDIATEIIRAVKAGVAAAPPPAGGGRMPVSVKTRIGFDAIDMSWPELLLKQNLDALTIHGRTAKEMSLVPAHWDIIGQIKEMRDTLAPQTILIGNGDVEGRAHGESLAAGFGLDGIMIGRGIFHNPFCFTEKSLGAWQQVPRDEKIDMYRQHVALFLDTWGEQARPIHTLNKFCKMYVQGFDGAKELREHLMAAKSGQELSNILQKAMSPAGTL